MDETLERLKSGIRKFQWDVHGPNAEAYLKAASQPQRPHTLVIACADSRVDVETITSAGPGELFISRNVGNMAPVHGAHGGTVGAVVEYAVVKLKIRHIAICGHSDCGAMKALLRPGSDDLPTVARWLTNAEAALAVARALQPADGRDLLTVLTEQNVLAQMTHLRTHPAVAGAMAHGDLTVSGWVYEIGTGEVRIATDGSGPFVAVEEVGAARHG
jgi:carbonic anhydrase